MTGDTPDGWEDEHDPQTDVEEQSVPDVSCPACGADAPEFAVKHNLHALGYLADDISMACVECGHSWLHGVPIGEGGDDMTCRACGQASMRVHQINETGRGWRLHFKCPRCFYWRPERRLAGQDGYVLVGDADLTGAQDDGVQPKGHEP